MAETVVSLVTEMLSSRQAEQLAQTAARAVVAHPAPVVQVTALRSIHLAILPHFNVIVLAVAAVRANSLRTMTRMSTWNIVVVLKAEMAAQMARREEAVRHLLLTKRIMLREEASVAELAAVNQEGVTQHFTVPAAVVAARMDTEMVSIHTIITRLIPVVLAIKVSFICLSRQLN